MSDFGMTNHIVLAEQAGVEKWTAFIFDVDESVVLRIIGWEVIMNTSGGPMFCYPLVLNPIRCELEKATGYFEVEDETDLKFFDSEEEAEQWAGEQLCRTRNRANERRS